ncbi:MAG: dockerin type I repeat-containing protein [Monoglobaceae bacterium]
MKCKKILSAALCFAMTLSMTSIAFAASWNADDEITITVDVFDLTGNQIYRSVGSDTVTKGDQYIQSDPYKIPELSKFTTEKYVNVQEVTGNWYGTSSSKNVGSIVYFSCNSNTARITYWVTQYGSSDAGSGSGSDAEDSETINNGSKYSWTTNIKYHSNYPNGDDYVYTVNYKISAYTTLTTFTVKSFAECGFSEPKGYKLLDSSYWNKAKDGSGDSVNSIISVKNTDKTIDLYAQYEPEEIEIPDDERYTITYKSKDTVIFTDTVLKDDSTTILSALDDTEGEIFVTWSDGNTNYEPETVITPTGDMELTAVWKASAKVFNITYLDGNDGKFSAVVSGMPESTQAEENSVIKLPNAPSKTNSESWVFKFAGWSDGQKLFSAGDEYTVTGDVNFTAVFTLITLNGDDEWNALDTALLKAYVLETYEGEFSSEQRAMADFNSDGKTDTLDVAYLKQKILSGEWK